MYDVHHRLAANASCQLGLLRRCDVLRAGGSDDVIGTCLDRGAWQQLHPGVYLTGSAPPTWLQRQLAACYAAGPNAVASHRGAAAVWELDGALEGPIEITVAQPYGPTPRRTIVHRTLRSNPIDRKIHRRVPVSSINRTLVDYGAVAPRILVERGVEDAFRRGLTNEGALRRRLAQIGGPGCRGAGQLRWVLDHRFKGKPARSGFEVIAGDILRSAGMQHWLRNHTVWVEGQAIAELDLADPVRMVAVEPAGARWHSTRRACIRDEARAARLRALGWNILDVTWDEAIYHPEVLIGRVRSALCGSTGASPR